VPVIHLIRHGQASFGADDYDVLSALGAQQGRAVGGELLRRGITDPLITCGDLRRQVDTAEAARAAGGFGGQIVVDPRWNEYDHVALVAGHEREDPKPPGDSRAFQDDLDSALTAWMGEDALGAGWVEFRDRARGAFDDLATSLGSGDDAVAFTSGGVIAAIVSVVWELPPAGILRVNRVVVNGSITTAVVGRRGVSLLAVNDHAHLLGRDDGLLTYR
jgi:broad specificity phosphatase PhoE